MGGGVRGEAADATDGTEREMERREEEDPTADEELSEVWDGEGGKAEGTRELEDEAEEADGVSTTVGVAEEATVCGVCSALAFSVAVGGVNSLTSTNPRTIA